MSLQSETQSKDSKDSSKKLETVKTETTPGGLSYAGCLAVETETLLGTGKFELLEPFQKGHMPALRLKKEESGQESHASLDSQLKSHSPR